MNPLGKGIAGTGKGIILGACVKGGTMIAGKALAGSAWGPIGTIGGAVVGLGRIAAGWIDYSTAWREHEHAIQSINESLDRCLQNCDPAR